MSNYGHCVHCAPDCHGGEPLVQMHQSVEARPHTGDRAWWDHDDARTCCPACAVADLIDAELQALSDDGVVGWIRVGLTRAALIARGADA
jgi:anaerobic selenocysteine-containing dehydrogenase